MLLGQKVNALAMLGSQDDIDDISRPLQSNGIYLNKRNIVSAEDLLAAIKKDKNIEYVILSDSGMLGVRDGIYTIPLELAGNKDLYIAIFFNITKYNKEYLRWAAGLGIESVYFMNDPIYTDESGAYDFNKILKELKEKKRIFTTPEEPSENIDIPFGKDKKIIKIEVEKEVIKEVEKIVEVPIEVEKIVEIEKVVEIPVEKIIEKEVFVESQRRGLFGRKQVPLVMSKKIIGVYGSSPGAGVTSLCLSLARYFSSKGHKVALLERNDRAHLAGYKEKGIDIVGTALNELNINAYDYILIDFGCLYYLSKDSPAMIKDTREEIQERQLKYGIERKYCTSTIMVCPTAPWRIGEARFFLEDIAADNTEDWIFYFNGDPDSKEFKRLMTEYHDESRMVLSFENKQVIDQLCKILNQ